MAQQGQQQQQCGIGEENAAPQFLAPDPADIQALGQAITYGIVSPAHPAPTPSGVRKIPLLEEKGDSTAWATWISRFETVVNIARWNDARMKAELNSGMSGAANP